MTQMIPDPTDSSKWFIGSAAEPAFGAQVGDATLVNVHPPERCVGRPCVVHHPSDHHMRGWSLNWRGDSRLMERMCPHGIGHPDPDDMTYQASIGQQNCIGIHGCDGCCTPRER
jgi:hypothetical protein